MKGEMVVGNKLDAKQFAKRSKIFDHIPVELSDAVHIGGSASRKVDGADQGEEVVQKKTVPLQRIWRPP